MGKFTVAIGNDFEINDFEVGEIEFVSKLYDISEAHRKERFKEKISWFLLGSIAVALTCAAAAGFCDGSYNELNGVWSASALPLGLILKSYFEKPVPT